MKILMTFPTRQAAKWASQVDLYDREGTPLQSNGCVGKCWLEHRELLQDFQQLSVARASFEVALLCYDHFKLTKKQEAVLRLIYDTTEAQVRGFAINVITDRMEKEEDGKKLAEAGKLLFQDALSQSTQNEGGEKEGVLKVMDYGIEDLNA